MIDQDDFNAITDKIPQKPMTAAEGVSYTAIILAAFGVGTVKLLRFTCTDSMNQYLTIGAWLSSMHTISNVYCM